MPEIEKLSFYYISGFKKKIPCKKIKRGSKKTLNKYSMIFHNYFLSVYKTGERGQ